MTRALDQTLKEIYRRRARFETPGWVLSFIGLSVGLTGIWARLSVPVPLAQVTATIGFTLLGIGLILIAVGHAAANALRK